MGRPKSTNPRTEVIPCKATKGEKKKIKEQAKKVGLSTSEYLRNLGMNYPLKSVVDQVALSELIKTKADLGRLGGLFKKWLVEDKDKNLYLGMRSHKEIDKLVDEIEEKQTEILEISKKLLGA